MSDYIKREDAESGVGYVGIDKDYFVSVKEVLNITAETGALETQDRVRDLPPVDAVEVVRCKDCRYEKTCCRNIIDDPVGVPVSIDYCSYGERKEKNYE